jgi:hypothetical protein
VAPSTPIPISTRCFPTGSAAHDLHSLALDHLRALKGHRREAISSLRDAMDHGYRGSPNAPAMLDDPDFSSLRDDPEFEEIVRTLRQRGMDDDTATIK